MEVLMQPLQLASLVAQLNFELQEHIIHCLAAANADCIIGWGQRDEDPRLEVRSETKMIEIRSVVLPVAIKPGRERSLALTGARFELIGARRLHPDDHWIRTHEFGDAGTLVFTLASLDPEHVKQAAATVADTIVNYLDTQLETC